MLELIKKKRNGLSLSDAEIRTIIQGLVSGEYPDYQVAAFLMAVFFQGLDTAETASLTDAMMRSGELVDLSEIPGIKVDKHSTGGVGDKTTLVLAPLVAAAGVPVAKMSGRGLGHTGGTLDKLQAIPGFSTDMSKERFIQLLLEHDLAICGQNANLVPADKKLYALRDVTATVDNKSLISSSIMSKKLACGADAIVIDIKVGAGAFMRTVEEARELAELLIGTGREMGREVVAFITAMEQPLGRAIGNALEVAEAMETLQGRGPEDLRELCIALGSEMLRLAKVVETTAAGRARLEALLESGAAFEKFKTLISAQGGSLDHWGAADYLPQAAHTQFFTSPTTGYIHQLNARDIGLAAVQLGAGRATQESQLDLSAGIVLQQKVGDWVEQGTPLAVLYANDASRFAAAIPLLEQAYRFGEAQPGEQGLILDMVR